MSTTAQRAVTKPLKILVIEDDADDVVFLEMCLRPSDDYQLESVIRLSEGLERLEAGQFDLVLLDLTLPDSRGIDTYLKFAEKKQRVPVVVVTGSDDGDLGIRAVREGAQDYLVKGHFDSESLSRAIHYAIERQRIRAQLEEEVEEIGRWASQPGGAATAVRSALRERDPDHFDRLAIAWAAELDSAIAKRDGKDIERACVEVAEDLGRLGAGPRDAVELHSKALSEKVGGAGFEDSRRYVEEGRMMLLRLLGHLAAHYRARALAGSAPCP